MFPEKSIIDSSLFGGFFYEKPRNRIAFFIFCVYIFDISENIQSGRRFFKKNAEVHLSPYFMVGKKRESISKREYLFSLLDCRRL